jgi:lysylphosphatidylglycerol synthetase-like protein (DUF2156 family)
VSVPDPRRTPTLTARGVSWGLALGFVLLALLVGIAWRTTSAAWFLLFPLLLVGALLALAVGVLWGLRHF